MFGHKLYVLKCLQCQKILGECNKKEMQVLCNACNCDLLKQMAMLYDCLSITHLEIIAKKDEVRLAKHNLHIMHDEIKMRGG